MKKLLQHKVKLTLSVIIFSLFISPFYFKAKELTNWDNFGYYLVLPQTFIQGDPGNKNVQYIDSIRLKYNFSTTLYQIHDAKNGYHPSQYSLGMAVVHSPAFFIGHAIAKLSGYDADGYSSPYQYALIFLNILYMSITVLVLYKVFRFYFSENISLLLIFILHAGTNYCVYAYLAYGMPHSYLLLGYSLLIYFTIHWHRTQKIKFAFFIGLILGLMTIIRISELIAVLIPFLWSIHSMETFKLKVRTVFWLKARHTIVLFAAAFLVLSLQLIYWKLFTGHFFYLSYQNPGEGFEFAYPHTLEFLFSYRKGWFVYTPVMLLAVLGLFFMLQQKVPQALSLLCFTVVNIYLLSSWSNWYYAGSFGHRAMIQSYPVYLLGLGYLIQYMAAHKWRKIILSIVLFFFLSLNIFQAMQLHYGVLDLSRMTKDYYWSIFGKLYVPDGAAELLMIDRMQSPLQPSIDFDKYEEQSTLVVKETDGKLFTCSSPIEYGPGVKIPYQDMTSTDHCWIKINLAYKSTDSLPDAGIVTTMINKDHAGYQWLIKNFSAEDKPIGDGWKEFTIFYLTPEIRLPSDNYSAYFWSNSKDTILIRNFNIKIFTPK